MNTLYDVVVCRNRHEFDIVMLRYRDIPLDVAEMVCSELFTMGIFRKMLILEAGTDIAVRLWEGKEKKGKYWTYGQ